MDELTKRELEQRIRSAMTSALRNVNNYFIVRELEEVTKNLYLARVTVNYVFVTDILVYDLGTRAIVFFDGSLVETLIEGLNI